MTAIKVVDYYIDLIDVPSGSYTPSQVNSYIDQFLSEIQNLSGTLDKLGIDNLAEPGILDRIFEDITNLSGSVDTANTNIETLSGSLDNLLLETEELSSSLSNITSNVDNLSEALNSHFIVSDFSSSTPNSKKIIQGEGVLLMEDQITRTLSVSIDPAYITSIVESVQTSLLQSMNVAMSCIQRNEIPAGIVDGINTTYTLAHVPFPPESLSLFYNGQLLDEGQGNDFVLDGKIINTNFTPIQNDLFRATYVFSSTKTNDRPVGPIDGVNRVFLLDSAPSPPQSLSLYYNGQLLDARLDFVLDGNSVILSFAPLPNDVLRANYTIVSLQTDVPNVSYSFAPINWNEVPIGSYDGINTEFSLSSKPASLEALMLYYNGQLLDDEIDFSLDGKMINLNFAPKPTDKLKATYTK